PADYAAGGWWKDSVTVSSVDSGDAVLADGSPGSGVNASTLIQPINYHSNGTFTASDPVADLVGWKSPIATLTVRVDAALPTMTLKCGDVKQGATFYATFTAKDDQSGLASPPSGSV